MRLSAVMLIFKEQNFVEACIKAIYPVVDSICCTTRHDRNFYHEPVEPDATIQRVLSIPDPDNKIKLVMQRDLDHVPGENTEARLRNAAMQLDPQADYYLIVDSDEIWPTETLRRAWAHVQREQLSSYRVQSVCFFAKWNYKVIEPPPGVRMLAFLRRGFLFQQERQVNWWTRQRWLEYLRLGRKPKSGYLPPEMLLYHGSGVGDDARILSKIKNWGHRDAIDPDWFENVWKKFSPETKDFHYFRNTGSLYNGVEIIPTRDLPDEIRQQTWPEGWILPEE